MLLTEIDHIAIAVKDLEAAVEYYKAAFGAEVHHREFVEKDGVEEALVKVADIDAKLRALNVARAEVAAARQKRWDSFDPSHAPGDGA